MWTDRHRTRHETRLKDIVVQAGLDEMARLVERVDPPGSASATPARRVVAAIAWHLRVGGTWRALPAGFPPWRTVYGWFRRWIEKGVFEILMRAGARRQRRRCGRRLQPRLAIIDTQSVKCIGVRGPRGYEGAKKLVGRKRVLMVDAEGFILAVTVVPANVQDCDTLPALDGWQGAVAEPAPGDPRRRVPGPSLRGVVQPARHALRGGAEGAGSERLRRAQAALGGRADLGLVQPLGRIAA